MAKYIIREVPAEWSDFSFCFDCDCYSERSGDYSNTIFIVCNEGYGRIDGYNIDEYKRIQDQAESILEGFTDVRDGLTDYDGNRITYKRVMEDSGISYNPTLCHKLKKWSEEVNGRDTDDIAKFLTVTTGKYWKVTSAHGYSQGDYCEVITCAEVYTNAKKFGEIWLGAATEFCIVTLDDNGEEAETVYGYIVADCEAWTEERTKALICEWEGINPEDATLEVIDGQTTRTIYSYRTA